MDREIGRVLDTLCRCGVESNTLVWFMSDNGGPLAANSASNHPLRGSKGTVYEGGVRVPFVVSWPGHLPAGRVYPHPVSCLDVAPTLAALAGVEWPAGRPPDGVNLLPYLTGQRSDPPHPVLVWRQNGSYPWAVRTGRYKVVQVSEQAAVELYDLDADVSEQNNLSAQRAEEVQGARLVFEQWQQSTVAPRWQGPRSSRPARDSAGQRTRPAVRNSGP
jgi:arylsulfatase A-like enzyme